MTSDSGGGAIRLFRGAVAVVTGGASGIGLALGHALAERGAEVVLADRDEEPALRAAAALRDRGGAVSAAALDVRDGDAFRRLVEATVDDHERLDFLFNNAGIAIGGEVVDYRPEHWDRLLDVNIRGVCNGVQAAYPQMVRQGFGHLVNTASLAGLLPCPGGVAYGATKHAVVGLSRSLRIESRRHGVRVSALCPGVVRTSILSGGGRHGEMIRPVDEATQRRLWDRLRPLAPASFAARVLRPIARNRAIIVVPGWWRLLWWLDRLSPALGERASRWLFERTLQELWPATGPHDR
jgi:NAD(P)-dependent dehydrogenase (short-subunit alcohol dehydrogenase family)